MKEATRDVNGFKLVQLNDRETGRSVHVWYQLGARVPRGAREVALYLAEEQTFYRVSDQVTGEDLEDAKTQLTMVLGRVPARDADGVYRLRHRDVDTFPQARLTIATNCHFKSRWRFAVRGGGIGQAMFASTAESAESPASGNMTVAR